MEHFLLHVEVSLGTCRREPFQKQSLWPVGGWCRVWSRKLRGLWAGAQLLAVPAGPQRQPGVPQKPRCLQVEQKPVSGLTEHLTQGLAPRLPHAGSPTPALSEGRLYVEL